MATPVEAPSLGRQSTIGDVLREKSASQKLAPVDFGTRLHRTPKWQVKNTKTANDAVISDLSSDTLRWIKNRRKLDTDKKVVLSHHRERQLRDIFNGIDVGKNGSIDLKELQEAITYVEERLKGKTGSFSNFNYILRLFQDMDDNGDGKVDFQEFTNAMSGSAQSALDKASETDIANLHKCFIEFGVMKHRRHAIAKINDYTGLTFTGEVISMKHFSHELQESRDRDKLAIEDLNKYVLFKTLFEDITQSGNNLSTNRANALAEDDRRRKLDEDLLDKFIEENKRQRQEDNEEIDLDLEQKMDELHARWKETRKEEAKEISRDRDKLALSLRYEEEKRYFAKRRQQRPHTAGARTQQVQPGQQRPYTAENTMATGSLPVGRAAASSSRNDTSSSSPGPGLELDAHARISLQTEVKKEGYDILRSIRYQNPLQRARLVYSPFANEKANVGLPVPRSLSPTPHLSLPSVELSGSAAGGIPTVPEEPASCSLEEFSSSRKGDTSHRSISQVSLTTTSSRHSSNVPSSSHNGNGSRAKWSRSSASVSQYDPFVPRNRSGSLTLTSNRATLTSLAGATRLRSVAAAAAAAVVPQSTTSYSSSAAEAGIARIPSKLTCRPSSSDGSCGSKHIFSVAGGLSRSRSATALVYQKHAVPSPKLKFQS